ncbi:uncharacterized protein [Diadema antillarum]|uniref:uncharacterized protein n=1 Tax=Diadema antillarum TaxID=105358 RepID=UPI003A846D98
MDVDLEKNFEGISLTGEHKQPLKEIQHENCGSHAGQGSEEDLAKVAVLMKKARKAVEEGHPRAALEILQQAANIQPTEKVQKRIAKLEAYLAENGSEDDEEEDDNMVHVGKGFYVYKDLYDKLYDYQRDSLLWFWRLHRKQKGGILGDDMGLGKTVQVVAFLSGLFDMEQVSSVLIVVPVALVINWQREFQNWAPGIGVYAFHGASKKERERLLERVQRRGGVLMVSYGLVMTCWEQINHHHGAEFVWDYVILDEGHKIKNPNKTTKAVHAISATHRFILTGTPIQNNLKELWSLFNFVTHGTLLGTQQTFKAEYDNPITRAREKDATASEKLLGNEMAESLRLLIAPYFLRRTKADVLENKGDEERGAERVDDNDETDSVTSGSTRDGRSLNVIPSLTRKNDLIVWLSLTETQVQIYQDFISLDRVKELLMTKRSPLAELTILKKLCDHPRLLSKRACRQLGLEMSEEGHDENSDPHSNEMESAATNIHTIDDQVLLMESGKLQFLVHLLTNLRGEGHRCLVFSQSRKMLDIVQKVLRARHFKLMRLDGTITKLAEREDIISRFQGDKSYSVFLLTTQVGGVGLTLTGADRVVIIDPSWNPATDNQAVDRAYRIGQTRSVVIYRLITCGTVEEKIYRRQIFKESLTKQTTGSSKNPYRYFTRQELRELFVLDDPKSSRTQMQLEEMHAAQRKTDTELDAHIAFLYSLDIFGISDHDLMFSQEAQAEQNHEYEEEGNHYIQQRVQRAQELVAAESDLTRKLNDHIQRGTEGPGSALKKRYSMNINRERLQSEWMEKSGEGALKPPLEDIPKYYRPEDRPPPRLPRVDDAVQDLDRTMEDLTLDDTRGTRATDGGDDDDDCFRDDQQELSVKIEDCHEDDGLGTGRSGREEDEDLVIIDTSLMSNEEDFENGLDPVGDDVKRPPSVFVVEDNSRPGSCVGDRAFIEEDSNLSMRSVDEWEGGEHDNLSARHVDGDEDGQSKSCQNDADVNFDLDFDQGSPKSPSEMVEGPREMDDDNDDSYELVVGMSPPKHLTEGSTGSLLTGEGSDPCPLDMATSNIVLTSGSAFADSSSRPSKHQMPSDTDSYGMTELASGRQSDVPYFDATRQLSLEESKSLTLSRAESRSSDANSRGHTIEWEDGEGSKGRMSDCELRLQSQASFENCDGEFEESEGRGYETLDNADADGSSCEEMVEVSIASFCCQAQDDVDSVSDDACLSGTEDDGGADAPMEADASRSPGSIGDGEGRGRDESVEECEASAEESYVAVSVASFCVQAEPLDTSMNDCSSSPLHDRHDQEPKDRDVHKGWLSSFDMSGSNLQQELGNSRRLSGVEEAKNQREKSPREGDPREKPSMPDIDLNATSRLLGLTSDDSPFVDTSSPVVARIRGTRRRLVSDDEDEEEEEEQSEGKVSVPNTDRNRKRTASNVLVGNSEDEMEEDDGERASSSTGCKDSRLNSALEDSMADFIVQDSDMSFSNAEDQAESRPPIQGNAFSFVGKEADMRISSSDELPMGMASSLEVFDGRGSAPVPADMACMSGLIAGRRSSPAPAGMARMPFVITTVCCRPIHEAGEYRMMNSSVDQSYGESVEEEENSLAEDAGLDTSEMGECHGARGRQQRQRKQISSYDEEGDEGGRSENRVSAEEEEDLGRHHQLGGKKKTRRLVMHDSDEDSEDDAEDSDDREDVGDSPSMEEMKKQSWQGHHGIDDDGDDEVEDDDSNGELEEGAGGDDEPSGMVRQKHDRRAAAMGHSGTDEDDEEEDEEEEELDGESDECDDDDEDEDELDDEMREKYKELVYKGKSKLAEGNMEGALRAFLQALCIDGSSEKLQLIALKLKMKLQK